MFTRDTSMTVGSCRASSHTRREISTSALLHLVFSLTEQVEKTREAFLTHRCLRQEPCSKIVQSVVFSESAPPPAITRLLQSGVHVMVEGTEFLLGAERG